MIPRTLTLLSLSTALAACAGHANEPKEISDDAPMAAATLTPNAPTALQVVELPVPLPLPGQLMNIRGETPPGDRAAPTAQVDAANRAALREPTKHGYLNAVQVYPWIEGAVYRLFAAPEQVSDIVLQAGEALVSVASGDTVRWIIGDTSSGSGDARRTHILVKPSSPGLKTNLVIATNKRVYHLQMESTNRTAMAMLSWTYPTDALLAISKGSAEAEAAIPIASGMILESLNFGYRISGDDPSWRPIRAFDDGSQVFIEFPATLGQGEAPPLFVTGANGEAQLVNYRLRGRYYIVDRLFDAAELRLGGKDQDLVRIEREAAKRRNRRSNKGKGQ